MAKLMITVIILMAFCVTGNESKFSSGVSVFTSRFGKTGDTTLNLTSCHCACRCGHLYQECIREAIRHVDVLSSTIINRSQRKNAMVKKMTQCHAQKHFCKQICYFVFREWDYKTGLASKNEERKSVGLHWKLSKRTILSCTSVLCGTH